MEVTSPRHIQSCAYGDCPVSWRVCGGRCYFKHWATSVVCKYWQWHVYRYARSSTRGSHWTHAIEIEFAGRFNEKLVFPVVRFSLLLTTKLAVAATETKKNEKTYDEQTRQCSVSFNNYWCDCEYALPVMRNTAWSFSFLFNLPMQFSRDDCRLGGQSPKTFITEPLEFAEADCLRVRMSDALPVAQRQCETLKK